MTDRAHQLPAEDPWLAAASVAARTHLHLVAQPLVDAPRPAAVKIAVHGEGTAGPVTEHVWLGEVAWGEDTVDGVVLNRPIELRAVQPGDPLRVERAAVEDWILGAGGVALGGFTVQVVRSGLGLLARRRHDRAWGLRFPPPHQVRLRPGDEADALVDLPLPGES